MGHEHAQPVGHRVRRQDQPVTIVTNAARGLMLGEGALPPGQSLDVQILQSLGWIAGVTVVFALLSVRVYRRAVT